MPNSPQLGAEKFVRHLRQNAGAVAGQRIAAAGAAMREVDQNLQPLPDDLMALLAVHVDDEADAAGIVLVRRVVQTLAAGADRDGNCDCIAVTRSLSS